MASWHMSYGLLGYDLWRIVCWDMSYGLRGYGVWTLFGPSVQSSGSIAGSIEFVVRIFDGMLDD